MSDGASSSEKMHRDPLARTMSGLALLLAAGAWIEVSNWPLYPPLVTNAALGLVLLLSIGVLASGLRDWWTGGIQT